MDQQELIDNLFLRGNRIMLEYVSAQGIIESCSTRVEDLEGLYLVLQAPVVDNVTVNFRESQELTLRCLDDKKEEAYVANVFVIDIRQDNIPLLICSKPQKIGKTSLRRFSRFGVALFFEYSAGDLSGSGRINELSLSGCYAFIDQGLQVKEGMILDMVISITDEKDLVVKGTILRVDEVADNDSSGLAIDYHEASETVKNAIYDYIFQLQLTSDRFFGVMPDQD